MHFCYFASRGNLIAWYDSKSRAGCKARAGTRRRRRRAVFQRRACSPPCRWPWSNPESVDASPLRGPRLSGNRGEEGPRAVQLFVHQHVQLVQLGSVQQPSPEEQLFPGKRRQERERPVRLVLDREVDQNIVRRRPRELSLFLRVLHFRSSARRHHLPPLLLPGLKCHPLFVLADRTFPSSSMPTTFEIILHRRSSRILSKTSCRR